MEPHTSSPRPRTLSTTRPNHHRGGSSVNEQTKAHVPTLKGLGKSDCEVKIVSILESESLVPVEALLDKSSTLDVNDMQQVLEDARSPSLNPLSESLHFLAGSRTAQVQKALRRPVLAYKPVSDLPRLSPQSLLSNSPRQYVNDSTIRRLTSNKWAVRKQAFAGGKQDGSRLLKQIRKQIIFSAICRKNRMNATISTPEIYGIKVPKAGEVTGNIVVDMEYIPFHDVCHIVLEHDKAVHEWLIESTISIVDYELTRCTTIALKHMLLEFHAKAKSIQEVLPKSALLDETEIKIITEQITQILDYFAALPDIPIPVGTCHGDLTFQNMLVDPVNRELCVFDFLDTFLESPLQDIAKLLQDCRHHWFLTQIHIPDKALARAVTTLGIFYDRIYSAYYKYAFWDAVPLFEFFCLARILPYMTTSIEKQCILAGMQRISVDLATCSAKIDEDQLSMSESFSSNEAENIFEADNKTTVIVPALGADMGEFYADGQIKLLALNSSGRPLIVDSISSLDFKNVNTIIITVFESLMLKHCGTKSYFESLFSSLPAKTLSIIRFHYATSPTLDAVDTITSIITMFSITGPIFIKDADNDFTHSIDIGNYLTYLSIVKDPSHYPSPLLDSPPKWNGRPDLIDATHKSYVSFSYDNIISNIAYGSFVSSQFCCGGWSFISAQDFLAAATKLRTSIQGADSGAVSGRKEGTTRGSLKVLDVLWQLVCDGQLFFGVSVAEYEDWGSRMAWEAHKKRGETRGREEGDAAGWGD
ncbi:hypothetical protein N431DRAFT_467959 [Stipitochalara longipes BDJ]|nr:hypothetical protein N431DRAFT_467959 [Stipitochalara longipes BDJ]